MRYRNEELKAIAKQNKAWLDKKPCPKPKYWQGTRLIHYPHPFREEYGNRRKIEHNQ